MIDVEAKRYELEAQMFKALAHPVRIRLLEKLKEHPWWVCELAMEVGIAKAVASMHLSQLRWAGLITEEKHGTRVLYRLAACCVLDMIDCAATSVLTNRKTLLGIGDEAAESPS